MIYDDRSLAMYGSTGLIPPDMKRQIIIKGRILDIPSEQFPTVGDGEPEEQKQSGGAGRRTATRRTDVLWVTASRRTASRRTDVLRGTGRRMASRRTDVLRGDETWVTEANRDGGTRGA
ncbi:hypothetical protein EYF80_032847 [Liparis tanakae]|uniref:Uncharacterized protein n=1 Tax=Liparis tanakae TaxID=230148 RepID=A0A4Z2GU45_9TELE|nr:hypothetical protein EYF80_032847 [Liparis tanakae]